MNYVCKHVGITQYSWELVTVDERKSEMKYTVMLTFLVVLLFTSCEYESPLTKEHKISVDTAVVGLWEPIPEKGEQPNQNERTMILQYSDTEYLIHYPVGKNGGYYRGYPIKIADVPCVQMQVIGTDKGPLEADMKELFHVVSYQVIHGKLEIKILNTNLVDDDLKTMEELVESFTKHRDNINLFINPGIFRRVEE